jgi:hypothetical protein
MKSSFRAGLALLLTLSAAPSLAQEEVPPPPPEVETATPSEEVPSPPEAETATPSTQGRESACNDGVDDDGDGLADCADADCFDTAFCQAGGRDERSDAACSDWIDNDGDGATDCEDTDCSADGITVCQGSWREGNPGASSDPATATDTIPELPEGQTIENLVGNYGDADGERNDYLCSDGLDNDGDGRTDCQDFGCRFDPSVTVCTGTPGLRFSAVTGIAASLVIDQLDVDRDGDGFLDTLDPTGDVRFTRIQLRALGPIPFIENSFFLINLRAERTVRLTFATFNLPIGNAGHYFSINSGSGGLSPGLIVSTSKQPLLDPPFYLFNLFERGSGAAAEVGGPIDSAGILQFRTFLMGGSGEFNGNVGGRFFRSDERNFAYAAGGQLQVNLAGRYNRFDTPFLYTEVPLAVALTAGARFDQRAVERYVAWNVFGIVRVWRFLLRAESYSRYVLDFDGINTAFNVQASFLLVPRTLMLAADVGGVYSPQGYDPEVLARIGGFSATFRRPLEETQVRAALHWYYFRNIGILSVLYAARFREQNPDRPEEYTLQHEVRLEAQFRF